MTLGLIQTGSVSFASPFILPAALLLMALLWWRMYGMGKNGEESTSGTVSFADTDNFPENARKKAKRAKLAKFCALSLIAVLISVIAAGPRTEVRHTVTHSTEERNISNVMVVFDISGSMASKLHSSHEKTRFEMARDSLVYFFEDQKQQMEGRVRVGMLFYGSLNFLYRTPVLELDPLIHDMQEFEFRNVNPYPFGEWRQLQERMMARGTITPAALYEAARILKGMEGRDEDIKNSAIVLFVDIHETRPPIYEAIDIITGAGINVHVVSVTRDPSRHIFREFDQNFRSNSRLHYYDLYNNNSETELRRIGETISEMESRPVEIMFERTDTANEAAPALALVLYAAVFGFILISELLMRKVRTERR